MVEVEDIGIVAWHEEGVWRLSQLNEVNDLEKILEEMQSDDTNSNCIGLISKGEDYFIAIHIKGEQVEIALSDVLYASESDLAADVLEELELPYPQEEDDAQPAGDTGLLSEYGISAMEFEALANDFDLFPDEQLEALAARLGFVEQYLEIVEELKDKE